MNDELTPPQPSSVPPSVPNPIPPEEPQQPVSTETSQPSMTPISHKSYIVAWLLSFFLGTLGVDRFYLGRVGTGILKLITLGGLGIWALIDWICITIGVVRDKQGRRLKGYSQYHKIVIIISVLVFVVGIGVGIFKITHPNNISAPVNSKKVTSNLVEVKLETARLSFEYPSSWKVSAHDVSKTQDGRPFEYFALKSPDGFELGFQTADSSWFPNSTNEINNTKIVKEVLSSNDVGSGVVVSNGDANKPYSGITVARGIIKVGDSISTANQDLPTNPTIKDLYISINGGYVSGFSTLEEFNSKDSVKQAVLIFQSMKYY